MQQVTGSKGDDRAAESRLLIHHISAFSAQSVKWSCLIRIWTHKSMSSVRASGLDRMMAHPTNRKRSARSDSPPSYSSPALTAIGYRWLVRFVWTVLLALMSSRWISFKSIVFPRQSWQMQFEVSVALTSSGLWNAPYFKMHPRTTEKYIYKPHHSISRRHIWLLNELRFKVIAPQTHR